MYQFFHIKIFFCNFLYILKYYIFKIKLTKFESDSLCPSLFFFKKLSANVNQLNFGTYTSCLPDPVTIDDLTLAVS